MAPARETAATQPETGLRTAANTVPLQVKEGGKEQEPRHRWVQQDPNNSSTPRDPKLGLCHRAVGANSRRPVSSCRPASSSRRVTTPSAHAAYTDPLPGRRAGPRHTHTHARKQPQPRISTAIRTQTMHMRAHRQTHGGATYSLRCPRRRVEAYTHPRTHTAAPTHQHHPSGSSGGTSGAAVGRPTGAQHSRHTA